MNTRIPIPTDLWKKKNVTYRRNLLDFYLNVFSKEMCGLVMDLGGKRDNKRGSFKPPEYQARAWWYINLDLDTHPNIFSDVARVPIKSQAVDCIVCTEVLEHLSHPQFCVDEIYRLLRNDGIAFVSTPFFYPIHADPFDFQRFTEDGLRLLFKEFKSVEVFRMGGYAGVLGLLLELGIPGLEGHSLVNKGVRWLMKWLARWLFRYDNRNWERENVLWQKFTTGYFVKAIR